MVSVKVGDGPGALGRDLVSLGRMLSRLGMTAGPLGSVAGWEGGAAWVSPQGRDLRRLRADDLVRVDGVSGQASGLPGYVPVYLAVLRAPPGHRLVAHVYPPAVLAVGLGLEGLPPDLVAEASAVLGDVPLLVYRTPGVPAQVEEVGAAMAGRAALLLQNAGALVAGGEVEEVLGRAQVLERVCDAVLRARGAGPVLPLPPGERSRVRRRLYRYDFPTSAT